MPIAGETKPAVVYRRRSVRPDDRQRLEELIREQPDATLKELRQRGGFRCSLTTVWRALGELDLTHKTRPELTSRVRRCWIEMLDRLAAMLRFSGEVTTKRNARH